MGFYIQNTKNLVVLIALILFVNNTSFAQKNIKDYIFLKIGTSNDTLKKGDSLIVTAEFRNISKEEIEFYPKAIILLIKPLVAFGIENVLRISLITDLRFHEIIKPNESFDARFKVITNDAFFVKGMNTFWLYYRFELSKKSMRKFSKDSKYDLQGALYSQKVSVFLK
jgi:hypothetical protein